METNLYRASREWASRPDDERYLTLQALREACLRERNESWTSEPEISDLRVITDNDGLGLQLFRPRQGDISVVRPTHWAFNQLAQYAKCPAAFLREQPDDMTRDILNWNLENRAMREDIQIYARTNGKNMLRAITTPDYGRILDLDVVDTVIKVNVNGNWVVPSEFNKHDSNYKNTLEGTTLYKGDRNVFIFLVDETNPVMLPGETEPYYRGFFAWNSEVGQSTFGLQMFLYRFVCLNRIVWGVSDIQELRIKHTKHALKRFLNEGAKWLEAYSHEATTPIVAKIEAAKRLEIKPKKGDTMVDWLQDQGFGKKFSQLALTRAQEEENGIPSLWNVIQGVTAEARYLPFADDRVEIERAAGKLMAMVA